MFDPSTQVAIVSVVCSLFTTGGVVVVAARKNKQARWEANDLTVPQYTQSGFRIGLDWQYVARLEHDLGEPHVSESLAVCREIDCIQTWIDDMAVEDAIPILMQMATSGILSTEDLTQLTGVVPDAVKRDIKDPQGRRLFDPPTTPDHFGTQGMRWGLQQRSSDYLTMNEIRAMPVSAAAPSEDLVKRAEYLKMREENRVLQERLEAAVLAGDSWMLKVDHEILDKQQADFYKKEIANRAKEMLEKFNNHSRGIMVIPDGFQVTPIFRQGEPTPVRTEVRDASGGIKMMVGRDVQLMTAEEAQARGYRKTGAGWRRDVETDLTPEVTSTAVGEDKPEDQLFAQALAAMRSYTGDPGQGTTPGQYED